MFVLFTLLAAFAVAWFLAYHRMPALVWTVVSAAALGGLTYCKLWPQGLLNVAWVLLVIIALLAIPSPLRRAVAGAPLLKLFRRILPVVSQTEQEALEAGTVWWDGELFSGKPDWSKLLAYPKPRLTAEEQAFIKGPLTNCAKC